MIGRVFKSRYELVGILQDGPIFTTYAARDRIQGRDLSIRLVKPPFSEESEFIDRLAQTVQKYLKVQSANVERLQSVESDDGVSFVLGDLTRGPSLADRIRKLAPFSIPVSVGTAISILHALESVHRLGLVHGDLNPQNMAVMADGDVRLQLTGVWEAYSASPTAGMMVLPGMAPYLAPEVSAGSMPSTTSDVYAVGILLYELIAGRSPYHAENSLAMAIQHSMTPTPSLRAISLAIPVVLDEIVKKAMSKDPAQRYLSASDMLADLRILQDALRFGRSLSWPLRPEAVQPTQSVTGRGPARQPQPVAPKMSAIRKPAESSGDDRPRRKERDVPVWMVVIFTVGLTLFLCCLGMWFFQNLRRTVFVNVPNLKGLSITDATALLKENKLTLRISRHETSETIEQDCVLDSDPGQGQKVREGDPVSVKVSSGKRFINVPELAGMTLDKAKTLLGNLNLVLSETVTRIPDPKIPAGMIIRSDPAVKTKVERQSLIRVFVSTGPGEAPPPSVSTPGQGYVYTLRLKIEERPEPVKVRIDMLDEDGTHTIYERTHRSGDAFNVTAKSQYSKATFSIYYDSNFIKSVDKDAEADRDSNDNSQPDAGTTGDGQ